MSRLRRGVTTREYQSESVVFEAALGRNLAAAGVVDDEQMLRTHRDVATAPEVNGTAPRDGRQPRPGVGRYAVVYPRRQGAREGVLHALFGDVEVACDAHRGGQHERPLVTVGVRDGRRYRSSLIVRAEAQFITRIGRTSRPPKGIGMSLAMAIAVSRSSASMT